MTHEIRCPCPSCSRAVPLSNPWQLAFDFTKCPYCGVLLVLKYDEIQQDGREDPIWWFETIMP